MAKDILKIILLPVDSSDGRKTMENIEDGHYLDIASLQDDAGQNIQIYDLTDFMDACNNQEIELELFWISYIYLQGEN